MAALANPERRIAALYATAEAAQDIMRCIDALPEARRTELPDITESERRRLDAVHPAGDGEKAVHQGMLAAVWPLEAMDLEDCIAGLGSGLGTGLGDGSGEGQIRLLLLDQLSDPRNVGAIMRSALALGAQAIITTHRNAPEESGALARAAAGALERVPMIRVVNLARAIERLQEAGIEIAGLAADGDSDVGSLREIERLGIVMGAEGTGLRHLTRRHCDRLVRINISEDSESLNVSIAAAIALYAARQD
ncbi:MAG: RNA methyltransferase [Alphaproteobacteria bacterium]|nr:RNA methyltransferase [Alphaproteobacteria bacterium]